jgi:tRNA (guanine-N7-)-methyltransferase
MRGARAEAFEQLDRVAITLPNPGALLQPTTLLPGKSAYRLEIGFGSGEHLLAEAMAKPDIGFLGAEPFRNGLSATMLGIVQNDLHNIRIYPDDARALLNALAPASLDMIYLLFSDPWRKARHAERRFVSPENLARIARALKPGARFRIATDDPGLQEWTEEQMGNQSYFLPAPGLYTERPNWPETRYESKAKTAGRHCKYYEYQRSAEGS